MVETWQDFITLIRKNLYSVRPGDPFEHLGFLTSPISIEEKVPEEVYCLTVLMHLPYLTQHWTLKMRICNNQDFAKWFVQHESTPVSFRQASQRVSGLQNTFDTFVTFSPLESLMKHASISMSRWKERGSWKDWQDNIEIMQEMMVKLLVHPKRHTLTYTEGNLVF